MSGYAHPEALVETDWLAEHATDPNVRVFEVDVDTAAYDQAHVSGAIGLNWKTDLQQRPVRDLLSKPQVEALLSKNGVTPSTTIAVYGDNNNWFAAWFFWLLKYYGHADVRLVNGGRTKWLAEQRPTTTEVPTFPETAYTANAPDGSVRALREYVLETVEKNGKKLVDVRSQKEFSGELLAPENLPQEGAQRAGHIKGAVNVPWATAVADDGRFKTADELRRIYGDKGLDGSTETIAYCRIGERSSHTWFVLKYLLGHEKVRNYDGSWTEYGSLIGAPIESGS
ncbi:MAG TPA: sulfurtransferase [Candidatus Saccharimonadales bacterium]|jgi:thiosulfate/3-mercaptopyruvate sulfurtransferase|nr:sulfurtransferase [Candidatus Saccharimonadales bacterium]